MDKTHEDLSSDLDAMAQACSLGAGGADRRTLEVPGLPVWSKGHAPDLQRHSLQTQEKNDRTKHQKPNSTFHTLIRPSTCLHFCSLDSEVEHLPNTTQK